MSADLSDLLLQYEKNKATSLRIATVDPATALSFIKSFLGILNELGLFSSENDSSEVVKDIRAHISNLYRKIDALSKKIDKIRQELIDYVDELDYKNISREVLGITQAIGELSVGKDRGYLDAAYLITESNHPRLLDRLDENWAEPARAFRYMRYFDLLLVHICCRTIVAAEAPSLDESRRLEIIDEHRRQLDKYRIHALWRMKDVILEKFIVVICGDPSYVSDDDGKLIQVIFPLGYVGLQDSSCIYVTSYQGLVHNDEARAKRVVLTEIDRVAEAEARRRWAELYG